MKRHLRKRGGHRAGRAGTCRPASLLTIFGLGAFSLGGCEPSRRPETAGETFTAAIERLSERHDPGVLWDLLPPSYQEDVRSWCRLLAKRLPRAEYERIFAVVRAIGRVLKLHADHLAANLLLQRVMRMLASADQDDLAAACSAAGDVCLLLGKSQLNTLAGLASIDPGVFLHATGRQIGRSAIRAVRVFGRDPIAAARRAKIEMLSATEDRQTLRLRVDTWDFELVCHRLEGRWIPQQLAERWRQLDTTIRTKLDRWQLEGAAARLELLDDLLADLGILAQTESRAKFEGLLIEGLKKYRARLAKLR